MGWAFRHAAALGSSSSSGGSCVLGCCSAVLVAALAAYKYKQRDKEGGGGVSEHKCVFVKPAWLGQSEEGLGGGLILQTYQCP